MCRFYLQTRRSCLQDLRWAWGFPSKLESNKRCSYSSKNDKQWIKNYRSVSLLSICWKTSERLLWNKTFSFFIESDLIQKNQSGFKSGDFWINQLLSIITYEIYKPFDDGWEVRGVSHNISRCHIRTKTEWYIFQIDIKE